MEEVLKPLYDEVVKVLEGKSFGAVSTGIPNAFVQVSKELIGYNCFGKVIRDALMMKLVWGIEKLREKGIVNEKDSHTEYGDVNNDCDIAFDLSQTLFPSVFEVSYQKRNGERETIEEIYAFLPYNKHDLETVFDILGNKFKAMYEERNICTPPEGNTEDLFDFIVNATVIPF